MTHQPDDRPIVDPMLVARWHYQHADLWKMGSLDTSHFADYSKERSVQFYPEQIESLWQLGMLHADLIKSTYQLQQDGIVEVGRDEMDQYVYIGGPKLVQPTDGWIAAHDHVPKLDDGITLLFHPFRFYPLHKLHWSLEIGRGHVFQALVSKESSLRLHDLHLSILHEWIISPSFQTLIPYWNSIADLAIASEPRFFSQIFGYTRYPPSVTLEHHIEQIGTLWQEVATTFRSVGIERLEEARQALCFDAERLDGNTDTHTILRLMDGQRREKVKGQLGGAMLLLTMAEMLRRGTEMALDVQLPEEDERGFGIMVKGVKERLYGSNRLVDGDHRVANEFLRSFNLDYAVRVRWYVEGDTEYGALESVLGSFTAIDVVNLHGQVIQNTRRGVSFRDNLRSDVKAGVFSFVMIDSDRDDYVRAVEKAASDDEICGIFEISKPDFELHNFSLLELEEIIWQIAAENGAGDELQDTLRSTLTEVRSGEELIKAAKQALPDYLAHLTKGTEWGRMLASYAKKQPNVAGTDSKVMRPFIQLIRDAIQAVDLNYLYNRKEYRVDPSVGRPIKRNS